MAHLVSSWSKTAKAVPQNYVCPPVVRPELNAPICKEIPVIDLSLATGSNVHDRAKVAEKLLKALDEYGCFQVINCGVSEKLAQDAMEVYKEFFNLPIEDKEKYVSHGTNSRKSGLYSGSENPEETVHLWRDTLLHDCHPLEQYINSWPEKPAQYRKVIAEYASETRKLSQKIFELIAEGLGLEKEYFDRRKFTEYQTLRANYYPRCPDPSLTAGLWVHYDPNIFTLLQQNVAGLQLLKDGKWMLVEPLPNGFFVLPGMELQIITNGRFKATLHQVVTNADFDRLSIGIFMSAPRYTTMEPEKAFVSDGNPQKYKDYSLENYLKILRSKPTEGEEISLADASKSALDSFLI